MALPRESASQKKQTGTENFGDMPGREGLKRALEIAAAGGHHILLFGPPGSGKAVSAKWFPGILPLLNAEDSHEVTRIHSLAGLLPENSGLISEPPFRMPHHWASGEGLEGGEKLTARGEVSLAHRGVLFLDEAFEFRKDFLMNLREPLETGRVHPVRADRNCWFPAEFQLILAANPCPCGNLGTDDGICVCSPQEVRRYWRQLGGALIHRVDMRIPVKPVCPEDIQRGPAENSGMIRKRVAQAVRLQEERFREECFSRNSRIPPGKIGMYCRLESAEKSMLHDAAGKLGLSSRAVDSVLKVARTIADVDEKRKVGKYHVLEALQYRRYGEGDFFWRSG